MVIQHAIRKVKSVIALWLLQTICLVLSPAAVAQPQVSSPALLPVYQCRRSCSPPQIDGLLSEPMWREAPRAYLRECITARRPQQRTVVRMLWDSKYLYVGARLYETDIRSTLTGRDAAVYTEQCFEVFLQHGGSSFQYLEADVSPLNTLFDSSVFNDGQDLKPNNACNAPDLSTAVRRKGSINEPSDTDRCWTLEMAIPLEAVPGGGPSVLGQRWRINLYRIHNWDKADEELSAWSPTGLRNFHIPQRFGWLQFTETQ